MLTEAEINRREIKSLVRAIREVFESDNPPRNEIELIEAMHPAYDPTLLGQAYQIYLRYEARVRALGYTAHTIAPVLGIAPRTSYRYADGQLDLTVPIDRLLYMLTHYGVPDEWMV